jgi:hypothetical protein
MARALWARALQARALQARALQARVHICNGCRHKKNATGRYMNRAEQGAKKKLLGSSCRGNTRRRAIKYPISGLERQTATAASNLESVYVPIDMGDVKALGATTGGRRRCLLADEIANGMQDLGSVRSGSSPSFFLHSALSASNYLMPRGMSNNHSGQPGSGLLSIPVY